MKEALVLLCGCLQMIIIVMSKDTPSTQMIRISHHSPTRPAATPFVRATLRPTDSKTSKTNT